MTLRMANLDPNASPSPPNSVVRKVIQIIKNTVTRPIDIDTEDGNGNDEDGEESEEALHERCAQN